MIVIFTIDDSKNPQTRVLVIKNKTRVHRHQQRKTATSTRTLDQCYQQKMFYLIGVIFKESSVFFKCFLGNMFVCFSPLCGSQAASERLEVTGSLRLLQESK